jgi:hypothetical protein
MPFSPLQALSARLSERSIEVSFNFEMPLALLAADSASILRTSANINGFRSAAAAYSICVSQNDHAK